jgi:hypothetical protein
VRPHGREPDLAAHGRQATSFLVHAHGHVLDRAEHHAAELAQDVGGVSLVAVAGHGEQPLELDAVAAAHAHVDLHDRPPVLAVDVGAAGGDPRLDPAQ